jgi:hypothetical protein
MTLRDFSGRHVEDTSIFAKDLIVLRKVDKGRIDPAIMEIIGDTDLLPHLKESAMPWFKEGFVANDHPRDIMVSDELIAATDGFAVARSDSGEILREYDGPDALVRAESAASRGKVRVAFDFEFDEKEVEGLPPVPVTTLDPEPVAEAEQDSQTVPATPLSLDMLNPLGD